MKTKFKIAIVLYIIATAFVFSGCFDRREIDDLTYVIAIGLDKGEKEPLRLTVQYAIPMAMGGSDSGGDDKDGAKSMGLVTVDTTTIYEGLNMVNNFVGKQLNMSHAKVAVLSEALARSDNVEGYISAMCRGREFRPNLIVAVSKGLAEDYLKTIKPKQEVNPTKYYELKFSNYKFTGFYGNAAINNFYNKSKAQDVSAMAVLVGVNKNNSSKDINVGKNDSRSGEINSSGGGFKAGELPRSGDVKGETMGMAVFNGGKMTGEFDGNEANYYLMASGEFNNAYMTFKDPRVDGFYVNALVSQGRTPECNVNFESGNPVIGINIKLEGDFLSIQSGNNYESEPLRSELEKDIAKYLKNESINFLNRSAKELGCDICGFGKLAKRKFFTQEDWLKYNWSKKYKDASFNVNVDFKIRRPGLMIRTVPAITS